MKYLISFIIRFFPRTFLQRFSHIILKVVAIFYKGRRVTCNVCDKRFRKFLPYGRLNPRKNALCPNCLSLERHRLMYLYLQKETNFFSSPQKVLHIAPEICFIDRFESHNNLDYITADIESPLAKIKMDVHDIPFEDNTFNVSFCNHVMEHVDDDIKAMSEIYRVLKPGGWAIIQIPFFHPVADTTFEDASITNPKEREIIFGQNDHVRLYGKDYGERLTKAGFKVIEEDFVKKLDKDLIKKHALPQDEIIYLCTKNPKL